MAHHIIAHIQTEPVVDEVYRTAIEWAAAGPGDDVDKHVRLMTNRFADELRRAIKAHQNG